MTLLGVATIPYYSILIASLTRESWHLFKESISLLLFFFILLAAADAHYKVLECTAK